VLSLTATDYIILGVLLVMVGLAVLYVYRAKKAGKKCIGCPHSATCGKQVAGSCCGCGTGEDT
jgi:hypothetical protein